MADYLSDEEQVAELRRWWEENGTFLVVTLLVVGGSIFGWRWYQDYSRTQQEGASVVYEEYLEVRAGLDTEGDVEERQKSLLQQLDSDYPESSYATFSLFYRATDALQTDETEKAQELLRKALNQAPTIEMKDLARTRLARLLEQSEKTDEALALLSGVSSAGYLSIAAELKGDILLARGDEAQARAAYALAIKEKNVNEERPILMMKSANLAKANEVGP